MQRQRGDLVPIGEAFSDLSGPVAALRDALPQARRGFTVADQVHQLVSASEADPERGFMVRMMALCSRHCHVNWLTMDQATISTTQTWFYERYRGAISACDALT